MQNLDFDLSVKLANATSSKCSLLVPDIKMAYFSQRCHQSGGLSAYLSFMSENYLVYVPRFRKQLNNARVPNWNTAYQKKHQNLQKKSFTPQGQDWERFRHAALACGVSICFLFTFLMQLEADGFFSKIKKNTAVERNSSPKRRDLPEKLGKFSILTRKLQEEPPILHRKLQIR